MRPTGFKHTQETKDKLSKSLAGKLKGYKHSEQSKENMSKAHIGKVPWNKGIAGIVHHSDKTKEKISKTMTGRKLTKEHIKNALRRRNKSSLEYKFENIIAELKLQYKFVGNGEIFIGRKNPDFVHNKEKIAVEVYYTKHKEMMKGSVIEWINKRKEYFNNYGWKLIFFNEVEVNKQFIQEKLCQQ